MKIRTTLCLIVVAVLTGCASPTPRSTAQQYCKALLAGDFAAFKSLFDNRYQFYLIEGTFKVIRPSQCQVGAITPPYATIEYHIEWKGVLKKLKGSLYLFPNGRIKYDPLFVGHPALALRGILRQMENDNVLFRKSAFRTLTKWKLPTFGFRPEATPQSRRKSISRFRGWVEKNEGDFDIGDVKIPLSPFDQKRIQEFSTQQWRDRTVDRVAQPIAG
jgi:hypothetical protein